MRYFRFAVIVMALLAQSAFATPTNPVNGAEYKTLSNRQTVSTDGKKVEVIEFFMYHCPACNMLEPALMEWVKKQGDHIQFKRIHVPHNGPKDVEARLFLTLEAMQLEESLHTNVLRTWHVDHNALRSDEDNIAWAVKNGIDKDKFVEFYNSFSVLSKLQNLARVTESYQVDSTPTVVVDGQYLTSMSMVDASNRPIERQELNHATMQVLDALVIKAQTAK